MTLGCDKHSGKKKTIGAQMCPWIFTIQNLLQAKAPIPKNKEKVSEEPSSACLQVQCISYYGAAH